MPSTQWQDALSSSTAPAFSSAGRWAVQWPPASLCGSASDWGRERVDSAPRAAEDPVREFAAALLDRVIDDAMLPHARKRAELRRKRRVNQMLALANE